MTVTTNAMYDFEYDGTFADDAARAKSLGDTGPLLAAKEHKVVVLLPDALDAKDASHVIVPSTLLHTMMTKGLLFDSEVTKGGVHFSVRPARWRKLTAALDSAGFDWKPIRGEATVAVPIAKAKS